jgi:hypothetical protein
MTQTVRIEAGPKQEGKVRHTHDPHPASLQSEPRQRRPDVVAKGGAGGEIDTRASRWRQHGYPVGGHHGLSSPGRSVEDGEPVARIAVVDRLILMTIQHVGQDLEAGPGAFLQAAPDPVLKHRSVTRGHPDDLPTGQLHVLHVDLQHLKGTAATKLWPAHEIRFRQRQAHHPFGRVAHQVGQRRQVTDGQHLVSPVRERFRARVFVHPYIQLKQVPAGILEPAAHPREVGFATVQHLIELGVALLNNLRMLPDCFIVGAKCPLARLVGTAPPPPVLAGSPGEKFIQYGLLVCQGVRIAIVGNCSSSFAFGPSPRRTGHRPRDVVPGGVDTKGL